MAESLALNALLIFAKERKANAAPKEQIDLLIRVPTKHTHLPELVRIAKAASKLFSATDKADMAGSLIAMYQIEDAVKAFDSAILGELVRIDKEMEKSANREVPAANHNN